MQLTAAPPPLPSLPPLPPLPPSAPASSTTAVAAARVAGPSRRRPPSPPPSPPSACGDDVDASDGSDAESVSRPSVYPAGAHVPAAREAPFEAYYGAGPAALRELELLDELKGARLEGLYNLSFLLLCFALFYMGVRNVAEHGFRAGLEHMCVAEIVRDGILCTVYGAAAVGGVAVCAFGVVELQLHTAVPRAALVAVHGGYNVAALAAASVVITRSPINPLAGGVLCVVIVSTVLKAHSYVITNVLLSEEVEERRRARRARRAASAMPRPLSAVPGSACASTESLGGTSSGGGGRPMGLSRAMSSPQGGRVRGRGSRGETGSLRSAGAGAAEAGELCYPQNVTLSNFLYFMAAPTLTYELNYPRKDEVRVDYLLWHAAQVVFCLLLQYGLLMQFCAPVFQAVQGVSVGETVLLVLRLAIPAFSIFLLTFWGFFHCILSLIAELLRFADRGFYLDWWNATSVTCFWRKWNVPVHEWCHRHIFFELNGRRNVSARSAAAGVFFISALLHEYVVATAFKVTPFSGAGWMFLGMCVQPPLMYLDKHWKGTRNGNLVMWLSLFLGQPLIVILYVRGYVREHGFLMCA